MKGFVRILIAVLMAGSLSGCMSTRVMDAAQGGNNPQGKQRPGYYFLLPITMPLDYFTLPLQYIYADYKDHQENPQDVDWKQSLKETLK